MCIRARPTHANSICRQEELNNESRAGQADNPDHEAGQRENPPSYRAFGLPYLPQAAPREVDARKGAEAKEPDDDVVPVDGGGCRRQGAPEYYDLEADPYQLDNLLVTDPNRVKDRVAELQARFDKLQSCSGIEGRDTAEAGGFCE